MQRNPKFTDLPAIRATASDEMEWPRGYIAVLSADFMDSPADDSEVSSRSHTLLGALVHQYGGRVFQDKGTGMLVAFEHAHDAVQLAVDFQQAAVRAALAPARMGIHTLVESVPPSSHEKPEELSVAARIEHLATGGQILLSDAARVALAASDETGFPLHTWPNRRLREGNPSEDIHELLYSGRVAQEPGARFLAGFISDSQNRYVARPSKEIEVIQAFNGGHLVALQGAGGTGKTRLAARCAVELAGLLLQPLHAVSLADPACTPETTQLELVASKLGAAVGLLDAERDAAGVLAWAARTEAILFLDDCDTVASAALKAFIGDLVKPGKVRVLLTAHGEVSPPALTQVICLNAGMEADEAECLFTATVQRQVPNWCFPGGEAYQHFSTLLALTESLPLALELTAAHVATESVQSLTESLSALPLPELPVDFFGNRRVAPETASRQRSLLRCQNWAWRNLPKTEQSLFCLAGLFAAPFTHPVIASIAERESQAVLESLKRLCTALLMGFDTASGTYYLQSSIAEYARVRLKERPDVAELASRFVHTYLKMLPVDGHHLDSEQVSVLQKEWQNLLQAHRYAVATKDFKAALHFQHLGDFTRAQGKIPEYIALVEATDALMQVPEFTKRDHSEVWQAAVKNTLAEAYRNLPSGNRDANLRAAIACYEASLDVRTPESFPQEWATTQNNLGMAYSDLGSGDRVRNLQNAMDCYEATLRVKTREQFPVDWAMTQFNLAFLEKNMGDYKQARIRMEQAQVVFAQYNINIYIDKSDTALKAWKYDASVAFVRNYLIFSGLILAVVSVVWGFLKSTAWFLHR